MKIKPTLPVPLSPVVGALEQIESLVPSVSKAPLQATKDQSRIQAAVGSSKVSVTLVDNNDHDKLKAARASTSTIKAFDSLPASAKDHIIDLLGVNDTKLFDLLKSGKLTKKDHDGRTILAHLHAIKTSKMKDGVRSTQLVKGALDVLADRNQITQGPHGTCGAASLQQALWKKNPAEMVRMTRNLAQYGQSSLQKGRHTLKADPNAFGFHKGSKIVGGGTENRNDFNILFQSAVMRSAALVGGKYPAKGLSGLVQKAMLTALDPAGIANLEGAQSYNVRRDTGNLSSVIKGDSASHPYKLNGLLEDMTGQSFEVDTFIGIISAFGTMKDQQGKEPMALFNAGNGELHYVTIKKITDTTVSYQDTAPSTGVVKDMDAKEFKKKFILSITQD